MFKTTGFLARMLGRGADAATALTVHGEICEFSGAGPERRERVFMARFDRHGDPAAALAEALEVEAFIAGGPLPPIPITAMPLEVGMLPASISPATPAGTDTAAATAPAAKKMETRKPESKKARKQPARRRPLGDLDDGTKQVFNLIKAAGVDGVAPKDLRTLFPNTDISTVLRKLRQAGQAYGSGATTNRRWRVGAAPTPMLPSRKAAASPTPETEPAERDDDLRLAAAIEDIEQRFMAGSLPRALALDELMALDFSAEDAAQHLDECEAS